MKRCRKALLGKILPILTMGVVLQMASCSADFNGNLRNLVGGIANDLVAGFVFSAFNQPSNF